MKTIASAVMCACMTLAAGAYAQDAMKKNDAMAKDGMSKTTPSPQDCKDYMAKKDVTKKDDSSMKMDKSCAVLMKNDSSMKSGMKPNSGTTAERPAAPSK